MCKQDNYKKVDDYEKRLGIGHDIPRLKAAFEKAWDIRNFEIDKFWQRSAYFWGFIAFIFGGYVYSITCESSCIVKEMYLDLYIILLGSIFSVAWLLVIKGSKRWQDNWEAHIDKLEDEITGPLYKTLFYKGKWFFSVSKINERLAWVVITVWFFLFIRYIFDNCKMFKNMLECFSQFKIIIFVIIPIIAAIVFIILLPIKCQTAKGKIKADLKNKTCVFLERISGE